MITDLVLGLFSGFGDWLARQLPAAGGVSLPGASSVSSAIGKADSLLPVAGILQVAAGVLAAVLVFLTVRLVLLLRYVFLP